MDTIINYMKSVPTNFLLPIIRNYNSFTTLIRLIFNTDCINNERIQLATQLLNIIDSNIDNNIAIILKRYINDKDSINIKIENEIKNELIKNINENDACDIGNKLGNILFENEAKAGKTGLLVDWLSAIELEITNFDKHKLQMNLLFSKHNLKFRPLLMSLILQRASWKSLHNIFDYLLLENHSQDICPMSALDFFTALTKSPRLWQGRDKAIPKHYHNEDVLQLTKDQAIKMVQFILEEAQNNNNNWKKQMESRLELLLKCVNIWAVHIMKFLIQKSDNNIYCRELLLMIYMSLPFIGQNNEINLKKTIISIDVYNKTCSSAVDEVAHCLLSALAATPRSKDWPKKSQDLELCARKLTATHPVLVLRQLPMLAGSLKGRAQYEWSVLKSRGHLMLFHQVLGLMELLEPVIFEPTSTLNDLLDSFFLLLQYHGNNKDLNILVNRLVDFMQKWMMKDIKNASKYLQEHGNILNDIQFSQPGVKPLLSSVSLPIMVDSNAGAAAPPPIEVLVGTTMPPIGERLPSHWTQLVQAIQYTENLSALQELDHLTNKKPQLLENCSQYLYASISSPNSSIRSLSLILIIRWLKFNPQAASEALPSVLACLDSNNGDIVASILDRLADLITVMQEYSKVILTRVFLLGMKSNTNTTTNITKSIGLLSLQYGY